MVTDCFGLGAWDISDTEAVFVSGLLSVMKLVIPAALIFSSLETLNQEKGKSSHTSFVLMILSITQANARA